MGFVMSSKPALGPCLPLPLAPIGEPVRVVNFGTGKNTAHRLASMGINPGSVLKTIEHAHGGLIVAIGNTRLAIGPGIAHQVMVTPTDTP